MRNQENNRQSFETLGWFGLHSGEPCQTGDFELSGELEDIGRLMAMEACIDRDIHTLQAIYPYPHVSFCLPDAVRVEIRR